MTVRLASSDQEIAACFPVMRQLRPHLTADAFLSRVRSQARAGYRLARLEVDGRPVAVAGFRIVETLVSGRILNVDDLVTLDGERSKGHGAALLRWLLRRAEAESCERLELDSGVHRKDAHRFYEREGLRVRAYHFEIPVGRPAGEPGAAGGRPPGGRGRSAMPGVEVRGSAIAGLGVFTKQALAPLRGRGGAHPPGAPAPPRDVEP